MTNSKMTVLVAGGAGGIARRAFDAGVDLAQQPNRYTWKEDRDARTASDGYCKTGPPSSSAGSHAATDSSSVGKLSEAFHQAGKKIEARRNAINEAAKTAGYVPGSMVEFASSGQWVCPDRMSIVALSAIASSDEAKQNPATACIKRWEERQAVAGLPSIEGRQGRTPSWSVREI